MTPGTNILPNEQKKFFYPVEVRKPGFVCCYDGFQKQESNYFSQDKERELFWNFQREAVGKQKVSIEEWRENPRGLVFTWKVVQKNLHFAKSKKTDKIKNLC